MFFLSITDTDIVSAVAWSPDGQLLSCGDDKVICKWGADGESLGKIPIGVYATCISWFPATGKQVRFCLKHRFV
jgi:WD40 repeat protein